MVRYPAHWFTEAVVDLSLSNESGALWREPEQLALKLKS